MQLEAVPPKDFFFKPAGWWIEASFPVVRNAIMELVLNLLYFVEVRI